MSRPVSDTPGAGERRPIRELPSALERRDEILRVLARGRPLICLDYDGTLTPIVQHPDRARLDDDTREVLRRLARRWPMAVVSGRDAEEVRRRVGVEDLVYAGSHGLEMLGPGGEREVRDGERPVDLGRAEKELNRRLAGLEGVWVERKRFGLAVHFRQAERELRPRITEAVREVAGADGSLRTTGGKQVVELRPAVDWDKGRAVDRLRDRVRAEGGGRAGAVVPVYVGDDVTDEDAFAAVRDSGIGIAVRGEDDDRPTLARYSLSGAKEVAAFLRFLLNAPGRDGEAGGPAST